MTEDGNGGFPFPQMNRCPIGTVASSTVSGRHFLEQSFLPATAGAPALIKEQEDEGHLKETAANQTGDMHTQHTQASSHRGKVNMSIHAHNSGNETCHQQKHTSQKRTAFNQDRYFSCQIFVK